jgi:hypothetical protein
MCVMAVAKSAERLKLKANVCHGCCKEGKGHIVTNLCSTLRHTCCHEGKRYSDHD